MSPVVHTILLLSFIHWVADFVCQSRWMAENKSKSLVALGAHVLTYLAVLTTSLFVASFWMDLSNVIQFSLLNAALHFVTDFLTSRATGYYYQRKQIYAFFVVVGFDQFIHLATFILTLNILQP